MKTFLKSMQTRYTTKRYNPNGAISKEKIETLKEILILSPSSINSQPWKFIFIQNQEIKKQLASFSFHNKQKIIDCHTLIVFQSLHSIEDFEKRITNTLPDAAKEYFFNKIKPQGEKEIQNWMINQTYIALGVLLSACATMEIDSTPMEGIEREQYDLILQSNTYVTTFAVALGERDSEDGNQLQFTPKRRLDRQEIIKEI